MEVNLKRPLKKQLKQAVKALNDWHTHDQLCLMMAERLAAQANIHLEQGAQVQDMAAQQYTLELEGKNPCGPPRKLQLQLSSTHQGTRLWMAWPLPKLEYALCLHYADGARIEGKELPTVIARYQIHYHHVVEVILRFEHTFYKLWPVDFIRFKQEQAQNGENYIPFTRLANSAGLSDWGDFKKDVVIKSLEHLRNIALHDGLPGRYCKNPEEIQKCLGS